MTKAQKFLAALLAPIQDLRDAIDQLNTQRTIDNATGLTLTLLGKLVGRARGGVTDDEIFRRYVRAQISANKSDGLIEDVILIASLVVYDDAATYVVYNAGHASYSLRVADISLDSSIPPVLYPLLRRATGAGIRVVLEWSESAPEDTFTLDAGPGLDVGHLAGVL